MKIEFYVSDKERKTARKLITKSSNINRGLGLIHTIAVFLSTLLITFSLLQIIPKAREIYDLYPVFIICLALLCVGILIFFISKWYVTKKMFEKTGFQNSKITYALESDRIIYLTDDGLKQEILAEEIKSLVDIENYLLIIVRDNFAFFLPPNAFSDNDERAHFKDKLGEIHNNC